MSETKIKVVTNKMKTREELANPFQHLSYDEQLKLSGGKKFVDTELVDLDNGYFKVVEKAKQ